MEKFWTEIFLYKKIEFGIWWNFNSFGFKKLKTELLPYLESAINCSMANKGKRKKERECVCVCVRVRERETEKYVNTCECVDDREKERRSKWVWGVTASVSKLYRIVCRRRKLRLCVEVREREGGDMEGDIGRACSLGKRCVSEHANVRERERDCVLDLWSLASLLSTFCNQRFDLKCIKIGRLLLIIFSTSPSPSFSLHPFIYLFLSLSFVPFFRYLYCFYLYENHASTFNRPNLGTALLSSLQSLYSRSFTKSSHLLC